MDLTTSLIEQAKLWEDQWVAHKRIYAAAKVTYDKLVKLSPEVEAQVAALKGQAEGLGVTVTTLPENITQVPKPQLEPHTSKLQDDTPKIINSAKTEFDILVVKTE